MTQVICYKCEGRRGDLTKIIYSVDDFQSKEDALFELSQTKNRLVRVGADIENVDDETFHVIDGSDDVEYEYTIQA